MQSRHAMLFWVVRSGRSATRLVDDIPRLESQQAARPCDANFPRPGERCQTRRSDQRPDECQCRNGADFAADQFTQRPAASDCQQTALRSRASAPWELALKRRTHERSVLANKWWWTWATSGGHKRSGPKRDGSQRPCHSRRAETGWCFIAAIRQAEVLAPGVPLRAVVAHSWRRVRRGLLSCTSCACWAAALR